MRINNREVHFLVSLVKEEDGWYEMPYPATPYWTHEAALLWYEMIQTARKLDDATNSGDEVTFNHESGRFVGLVTGLSLITADPDTLTLMAAAAACRNESRKVAEAGAPPPTSKRRRQF